MAASRGPGGWRVLQRTYLNNQGGAVYLV